MRHFDVDFRDKNGERYQLSKRIAELTEALMANYFVYDTEVLEGVWFRDGKFTYEQREEGTWLCLLYTSPSPRDSTSSRMPSSA